VQPDNGPATDRSWCASIWQSRCRLAARLTLDIDFLSQLPRVVERTGWWGDFNLVGQWFPKIGVLELAGERGAVAPRWNVHEFHFNSEFYADFGLYDVHLTVPSDYTVGAVGKLQGTPTRKRQNHLSLRAGRRARFRMGRGEGLQDDRGSYKGPGSPKVDVRVLYPEEYVASAKRRR
jgi:hypothetical protein